jgi:hypothetical protein
VRFSRGQLTLGDRLGIGHVHRQRDSRAPAETGAGDKAWRYGDNVARASELAAPPVGSEQLHKFCITINGIGVGPRPAFQVIIQLAYDSKQLNSWNSVD